MKSEQNFKFYAHYDQFKEKNVAIRSVIFSFLYTKTTLHGKRLKLNEYSFSKLFLDISHTESV
jgi:hypothetical protein